MSGERDQHGFPVPRAPTHPVLSPATFGSPDVVDIPSVLDVGSVVHVQSGRVAIAAILEDIGIGQGFSILLPAYHCPAMVEPVVSKSVRPIWYRIRRDTSADEEDIEARIEPSTRALMVVHYFGFPNDLTRVRQLCDDKGILLIEDCSHTFFGEYAGRPVGSHGDYAFASSWKFFPIRDGGCLVSSRRVLSRLSTVSPSVAFQVKSGLNCLEVATQFHRFGPLGWILKAVFSNKDLVLALLKRARARKGGNHRPLGLDASLAESLPRQVVRITVPSKWIFDHASRSRIVVKRRANYLALLQSTRTLPGCKPLFPALPEHVVPYVFPLLVDEPEEVFPLLKRRGVPIVRFGEFLWESVNRETFRLAADYSRRVFQFPCHQEMTEEELRWIIREIGEVMNLVRRG